MVLTDKLRALGRECIEGVSHPERKPMHIDIKLPNKDRFTLREVASLLDKHVGTICRSVLRGVRGCKLRAIYVGGRREVRHEDLKTFVNAINSGPTEGRQSISAQRNDAVAANEAELDAAGL